MTFHLSEPFMSAIVFPVRSFTLTSFFLCQPLANSPQGKVRSYFPQAQGFPLSGVHLGFMQWKPSTN